MFCRVEQTVEYASITYNSPSKDLYMDYEVNRRIATSARTFSIVEHLSAVDAAGVSTLADELDMSKGIVHNHLSTLRELG